MQLEIVITLIVVGFFIPVIAFFVVRRIRTNRRKLKRGEIFDKEGERFEIIEDGKQVRIELTHIKSSKNLLHSINKFDSLSDSNKFEIVLFFEDEALRKIKSLTPNI
jgi:hypothetical protein